MRPTSSGRADAAAVMSSSGVTQSLRDAAQRGGQHGVDLLACRFVAAWERPLALQQRDLEQRERIDVWIAEPDRRLEHRIVAQQVLALPDAQQRVHRARELVLEEPEQRQI